MVDITLSSADAAGSGAVGESVWRLVARYLEPQTQVSTASLAK